MTSLRISQGQNGIINLAVRNQFGIFTYPSTSPARPLSKQVELVTAIHAAGLKWLFVALEFLDLALATVEGLSLPPGMVVVFDPPGLDSYTGAQLSLSGLVDGADEADVQNTNEGKDVEVRETVRICTRGSTGTVKVAVVPHKA
ncbi:hypothetical protein CRV24_008460 [Beauveria bassiana]|nr:hypothetical protein CRV24_008460 [Beauveria bassiana]